MMKNVLFITYHFPPFGGGGVQRPLKFVKYLPEFGWQPIVLTVKEIGRSHYAYDETFYNEIPSNINVYRSFAFNLLLDIIERKTSKLGIGRIIFEVRKILNFPDAMVFWSLPAIIDAHKILKQNQIDLVFTTSPPQSINLIGIILKKLLNIKWVADQRDPWTGGWNFQLPQTAWRYKWHYKLEKLTYQYSDMIIANTSGFKKEIAHEFALNDEKVEVITNGYDKSDFVNISEHDIRIDPNKFNIIYTGKTYYTAETPNLFLLTFKELSQEKVVIRKDVHVSLVGSIDERTTKNILKYELSNLISIHDYLPHSQSVSLIQQANLLLLITDTNPKAKIWVPGKTYEYIRSGTPILALVDKDGDCADIIRATRTGMVVDPKDVDGIKNAIYQSYCRWKENKLKVDNINIEEIQKYERRYLTQKLAAIFDRFS